MSHDQQLADALRENLSLRAELDTARDIIKDAAALLSEYMPDRWAGWHDKASRVLKK